MREAAEPDPSAGKSLPREVQTMTIDQAYGLPLREVALLVPAQGNLQDLWLTSHPYWLVFCDAWGKQAEALPIGPPPVTASMAIYGRGRSDRFCPANC